MSIHIPLSTYTVHTHFLGYPFTGCFKSLWTFFALVVPLYSKTSVSGKQLKLFSPHSLNYFTKPSQLFYSPWSFSPRSVSLSLSLTHSINIYLDIFAIRFFPGIGDEEEEEPFWGFCHLERNIFLLSFFLIREMWNGISASSFRRKERKKERLVSVLKSIRARKYETITTSSLFNLPTYSVCFFQFKWIDRQGRSYLRSRSIIELATDKQGK